MRLLIILLTLTAGTAAVFNTMETPFTVTSSAFEDSGYIPRKYTCSGEGASPALTLNDLPKGTKSIAIIMDDPDAPKGTFTHWLVWNLPAVESITENTSAGVRGRNGSGKNKYTAPCPQRGIHRYFFKVYALDGMLDLPEGSDRAALEKAIKPHTLAMAQLMGICRK